MKTFNIIYLFTFLFIFASCSQEDIVKGSNDDVVAKIQLELPSMQLPTVTKSASAEENQINDLWLYMFNESGQLIYQVQGTVGAGDATKAVTANLKATQEAVTLMALANVSSITHEFAVNTSKADILKSLVFDVPSQEGNVFIPMWGEVSLPNGLYTDDAAIKIPMTRALACVEVLVDENLVINFEMTDAYLVGTYNKGFVAPIDANGNLQKGTMSIPAAATGERSLKEEFHKNGLTNAGTKFYVPESLLELSNSSEGEIYRSLCLIVGGYTTIDGIKRHGYYRLDFLLQNTVNKDMDIERNTRYIFKIDAVHEYGEESALKALMKSIPDNASHLTASTTIMVVGDKTEINKEDCIEKGLNDITTDGMDYLAVNASTLTATATSYENRTMYYAKIQIFTNCKSGWKMIDMPAGIIAQQKEGEVGVFYETFIWIDPNIVTSRNPLFYIKAGGVWKTITITW